MTTILGIDPGLRPENPPGYGLLQTDPLTIVRSGTLRTGRDAWGRTLATIAADLDAFVCLYADSISPYPLDLICYEMPHVRTNPQTAIKLAHVCGVVVAVAARYNIPCISVQPVQAKLALTSNAKATKQGMIAAVKRLFGVDLPKDAADAVGIALAGEALWRRQQLVERNV